MVLGCVAVRVCGLHPAVVVAAHMQRLRAIAHVVPQPPGVEQHGGFLRLCVFMFGQRLPVVAEPGLQPLPHFLGLPGLHAYFFRGLQRGLLGMNRSILV